MPAIAAQRPRSAGSGTTHHAYTRTEQPENNTAYTRVRVDKAASPRTRVQKTGFEGGNIKMPTKELVYVWSSALSGSVERYDVRTWLAGRELFEERKFASRGVQPVYELSELLGLVGGGERKVRASLRRLHKAGLMHWSAKGPRFADSEEFLTPETLPYVRRMEALMPKNRKFFPMPRPMLRLLAGGVKHSVLATVFAHLLRCPHLKRDGWDPVGAAKANWVEAAFGICERSAVSARTHLIEELGWLTPVSSPVWHQKEYGGSFAVNLEWSQHTPAQVAEARATKLSTAGFADQNPRNGGGFADLDTEQPSPTEIEESDLGVKPLRGRPPEPPIDFSMKKVGAKSTEALPAPNLSKVIRADLPSVARVMELFEQALENPRWKARGWTPNDTYLERLNWAAAARRVHVRGGTNPPGLFVHLVSKRLWGHVSNDDEEAVRRELAQWMNPEPQRPADDGGGARRCAPKLSADGKVLRCVEAALRRHGVEASHQRVNRELAQRGGWSTERIAEARRAFESWRGRGGAREGSLLRAGVDDGCL